MWDAISSPRCTLYAFIQALKNRLLKGGWNIAKPSLYFESPHQGGGVNSHWV
jgi:hypothetical protein